MPELTLTKRRLLAGRAIHLSDQLHELRLRLHQEELERQGWMDFTAHTYEGF